MIQAVVLIKVERGKVPQTAQQLLEIKGVREVYSVTGEYDLVAMVRVKEYERLAEVVTEGISSLSSITSTSTMVAFKIYSKEDLEQTWEIGVD